MLEHTLTDAAIAKLEFFLPKEQKEFQTLFKSAGVYRIPTTPHFERALAKTLEPLFPGKTLDFLAIEHHGVFNNHNNSVKHTDWDRKMDKPAENYWTVVWYFTNNPSPLLLTERDERVFPVRGKVVAFTSDTLHGVEVNSSDWRSSVVAILQVT